MFTISRIAFLTPSSFPSSITHTPFSIVPLVLTTTLAHFYTTPTISTNCLTTSSTISIITATPSPPIAIASFTFSRFLAMSWWVCWKALLRVVVILESCAVVEDRSRLICFAFPNPFATHSTASVKFFSILYTSSIVPNTDC